MNTEPNEREEAPERIYIHPTSAEYHLNKWPLEPGEYVEYIRANLAATRMRERCVSEIAEIRRRHRPSKNQDYEYGFYDALDQVEQEMRPATLAITSEGRNRHE